MHHFLSVRLRLIYINRSDTVPGTLIGTMAINLKVSCFCSIKGEEFIVRATNKEDVVLEMREFEKQSSLFQEVFGLKPIFKCKRRV